MRNILASLALAAVLPAFAQISVGISVGPPPPPRVIRTHPGAPGPDYIWVDGYWYVVNGRYRWHDGYWTRPPYAGARWIGPRYENGKYFDGYWEGEGRRFAHDHRWDRDRNRDYGRDRDRDHDHDHDHDRDRDHDGDRR